MYLNSRIPRPVARLNARAGATPGANLSHEPARPRYPPRRNNIALAEAIGPVENNAPLSPTGENQQLTLAKVIGQAISEALAPLLAGKNSANLPDKYRGEQDGLVDNWITMMKRYLEKTCAQSSELDRAWTVIEFLEQEARLFVLNKPESERDTGQKVLAL